MGIALDTIINTEKYPIGETSKWFNRFCKDTTRAFKNSGAVELTEFLQPSVADHLIDNAMQSKSEGHWMNGMFPAYSDAMSDGDNNSLPSDHPMNLRLPASHRFLPGDLLSTDNPLRTLYENNDFIAFIKSILDVREIYPVADPMGCINLLFYEPDDQNGWHFDTTDFVISLMLQPADSGGDYEYIPDLRSPDDDNLSEVAHRMQNPDDCSGVESVKLQRGSLFLFKGKYTLHRVTPVKGKQDRIVAILSYHPTAGHTISDSSKLAMYGRIDQ